MNELYVLLGVLGGALLVVVVYTVIQLSKPRQKTPQTVPKDVQASVDELATEVARLQKAHRSTVMSRVRAGSKEESAAVPEPMPGMTRKEVLRAQMFKNRLNGGGNGLS